MHSAAAALSRWQQAQQNAPGNAGSSAAAAAANGAASCGGATASGGSGSIQLWLRGLDAEQLSGLQMALSAEMFRRAAAGP